MTNLSNYLRGSYARMGAEEKLYRQWAEESARREAERLKPMENDRR